MTSPLGGDYGKQLDVNNIIKDASHPNASPFPLADLNVSIQRGSYVSARCFDADRTWNLQTDSPTTTTPPRRGTPPRRAWWPSATDSVDFPAKYGSATW